MGKRNVTLTFALCTSLVVHGALLIALAWLYILNFVPPKLEALARPQVSPPPIIAEPPPDTPIYDTTAPPRDDSGETDGIGTANRSTPGDKPMQALKGYEQANLTQNDLKQNTDEKKQSDQPSKNGLGDAAPDDTSSPPQFGPPPTEPKPTRAASIVKPIAVNDPSAAATLPETDDAQQSQQTSPKEKPSEVANSSPAKEMKGADATASDTDSVPFAKANSLTFHAGKLDGRKGRRVKQTVINFGDSAFGDAVSLGNFSVVLGVKVDATGNPYDVVVLQSSGSPNIDGPAQRAMYGWWFEPEKDPAGHPKPDLWRVFIY